jgi:integrase/recombinase XerD
MLPFLYLLDAGKLTLTDDALIQPYSGHDSRQSLEMYSKLSLGDCQPEYEKKIKDFPI